MRAAGPADQRRVRPWSTQVVVPTDHGPVWFKANHPHLAHEAGVHAVLAHLVPDQVDAPLGVDPARGWLLTRGRGPTLRERDGLSAEDVSEVLGIVADVQRRVAEHADELLGAGLPDCSPATVPGRFDLLVDGLGRLPTDHPSHLDADAQSELRRGRPVVEEAAARLADGPVPASFQHGDAHPGNVFADGLRVFDFGDAQWAHPFETLAVPYAVSRHAGLDWRPAQDAYAAAWVDVVGAGGFRAVFVDAMVTQGVNRAFLWWGALDGARPDELDEWGDGPARFLRLALEPFEP